VTLGQIDRNRAANGCPQEKNQPFRCATYGSAYVDPVHR
jgi:hypothetical protein